MPPERIADLSSYLNKLVNDAIAQGKIAKITGNPVQVAAVAILSGGIAVGEMMAADIKVLAGNAQITAKAMARPMIESVAARGVGMLFDRLLGK